MLHRNYTAAAFRVDCISFIQDVGLSDTLYSEFTVFSMIKRKLNLKHRNILTPRSVSSCSIPPNFVSNFQTATRMLLRNWKCPLIFLCSTVSV